MKIVNLTPHTVNFVTDNGIKLVDVPASETIARVAAKTVRVGTINSIPVSATEYGEVENLPDPEEGTVYIVSALVAARVPDRTDVFIPAESVRDGEGRIVGCKSLGHI